MQGDLTFCKDCDSPLTTEEAHYYEDRCERCESLWHERIVAWRTGKRTDAELDQLYATTV